MKTKRNCIIGLVALAFVILLCLCLHLVIRKPDREPAGNDKDVLSDSEYNAGSSDKFDDIPGYSNDAGSSGAGNAESGTDSIGTGSTGTNSNGDGSGEDEGWSPFY